MLALLAISNSPVLFVSALLAITVLTALLACYFFL
jgi:hypothetical protein